MEEKLLEFGLTEGEAKIYVALLTLGPSQAGHISKHVEVNRTTTYQVLEKLIQHGLVSFIKKGKIRVYQAVDPKHFVRLQEIKVQAAKELAPQLAKLAEPRQESTLTFEGRKGIRTIMHEVLECKEYVSFGSAGQFLDVMKHDFLLYQKEKKRRKIKSRVILGKSSRNKDIHEKATGSFRFIDDTYMSPTTTWVFNDKVAIFVWSDKPVATVIQNREVAHAYRSYFELLWKQARS